MFKRLLGLFAGLAALYAAFKLLFIVTWTDPRDWTVGELVTASIMNAHVRDNLDYLFLPPSAVQEISGEANKTMAGTSFADVDSGGDPDLSISVTTSGEDVIVSFSGMVSSGASNSVYFDVTVDGTRLGGTDGITGSTSAGANAITAPLCFSRIVTGLSAGAHTFVLQWRSTTGTATLYTNTLEPQFWVTKR